MEITVNGSKQEFDSPPTVAELLESMQLTDRRVAVEVNREIVPRSRHTDHYLNARDQVEIVHAIGGG